MEKKLETPNFLEIEFSEVPIQNSGCVGLKTC